MLKYLVYFVVIGFLFACDQKPEAQNDSPEEVVETIDPKRRLVELNEALRSNVNDHSLYYERSLIYKQLNEHEAALQDINRAIGLSPAQTAYYTEKAIQMIGFREFGQAEDLFHQAIAIDPNNVEAHVKLAELLLYSSRNRESLAQLDQALRADKYLAEAYYLKGRNFMVLGDTVRAVSSFQTAVEQNSNYYAPYLELGIIHAAQDNLLAIDYYNNAIRINPNDPNPLYNKGLFCQEHEAYNEAIAAYNDILKIDPNYKEAHFNLGYVNMFYLKQYRQAAKHFSDAIRIAPKYYQAYYNRGYSYELMGDIQRAAVDYRNALELRPDYDLAAMGLERVQIP